MSTGLFGEIDESAISREANLSADGVYRYRLIRNWCPTMKHPWCGWIMLNPSTADHHADDPTIRRCMNFSRVWGYGGICVLNLFALRATNPHAMWGHQDPVGPNNDLEIRKTFDVCPIWVAAWGSMGHLMDRDLTVMGMAKAAGTKVVCLGVTREGHPKHPLYLPGTAQQMEFVARAAK